LQKLVLTTLILQFFGDLILSVLVSCDETTLTNALCSIAMPLLLDLAISLQLLQ